MATRRSAQRHGCSAAYIPLLADPDRNFVVIIEDGVVYKDVLR